MSPTACFAADVDVTEAASSGYIDVAQSTDRGGVVQACAAIVF